MRFQQLPKHGFVIAFVQIVFIVLFAFFTKYSPNAEALYHPYNGNKTNVEVAEDGGHHPMYGMFQDVHVMIFIGFGFLMTFLKKYGFGAVGLNFLVAAVAIQWAMLVNGFFHLHDGFVEISIESMIGADFVAAAVLISFGALLGTTTPLQLLFLTLIEIPIFVVNEVIGRQYFGAVDMGDSMFVHAFGAYFGLAASMVLYRSDVSTEKEGSSKTSDTFAMIGTIFLWLYWPSFNGGAAVGDDQHRSVINTYIAIAASCVTAFAISSMVDPDKKFDMVHIQNSTLAGGVAIGTSADLMTQPFGAIVIGTTAGLISVLGYHYLTPTLASRLRIHDTCGVHNLHGMPALFAGICGAIFAAVADENIYGPSLYEIFPHRTPQNGTTEFEDLHKVLPNLEPGEGRTAAAQAGFQLAALAVTMLISIVTGLITGLILRIKAFSNLRKEDLYEDDLYWKVDEGETDNSATVSLTRETARVTNSAQLKDTVE